MTETETKTYPCSWSISYRDYDGSSADAGCDEVATVLLFDGEESYGPARPFGFCSFHATTEAIDAERVEIAQLTTTCTGCGRPVWLAHPEEHSTGVVHSHLAPCTSTDHPECSCPDVLAYEAYMAEVEADERMPELDDPRRPDPLLQPRRRA